MKTRPQVYALEPCKQDLSKAREFGDLCYVYMPGQRAPSMFAEGYPSAVVDRMVDLAGYDNERDYIVASGNTAAVIMVVGELVARFGSARVLLFDAARSSYVWRDVGRVSIAK